MLNARDGDSIDEQMMHIMARLPDLLDQGQDALQSPQPSSSELMDVFNESRR